MFRGLCCLHFHLHPENGGSMSLWTTGIHQQSMQFHNPDSHKFNIHCWKNLLTCTNEFSCHKIHSWRIWTGRWVNIYVKVTVQTDISHCWTHIKNSKTDCPLKHWMSGYNWPFKHWIKSHLPFAGIIRSSPHHFLHVSRIRVNFKSTVHSYCQNTA